MAKHGVIPGLQNDFIKSAVDNRATEADWINKLTELALCVFEWKNVPETINIRFLESVLCLEGRAIVFRDDVTGRILGLKTGGTRGIDIYGDPVYNVAIGHGFRYTGLTPENSVVVYNNYTRTPTMPMIHSYANRLYELERTIDTNVIGQKTPKIVQCTEEQKLTLKNINAQVEGNRSIILLSESFDPNTLKSIDITVPYVSDKLQMLKMQIWSEYLSYIGIPSNQIEKRERVISSELDTLNAGTNAQRYTRLIARQEAAEKINKIFGTKIEVDFRKFEEKEVEPDGFVYDNPRNDP